MYNKKTMPKLVSGFTLVELMVSISVFTIIMVISLGSIMTILYANQKSKTLRSVMDNLNSTMDNMTRSIRFGVIYHCGGTGNLNLPNDCGDPGESSFNFLSQDGVQTSYSLSGGCINKSTNGGPDSCITSPDVVITNLAFRVYGSAQYNNGQDLFQPQVIIVVGGYVGDKPETRSTFSLQTTVSERTIDFP